MSAARPTLQTGTRALLARWSNQLSTIQASPRPLTWFRIGLSGVLLVQGLSLVGHLDELYGRHGIVAWSVSEEFMPSAVPNLSWVEGALTSLGAPVGFEVHLVIALYLGALGSLLLGFRTRLSAALAWLTHTALLTSGDIAMYGVDRFAQIGLFYCLCFPAGHGLSLDKRAGRVNCDPSHAAWLGLWMLRLHVCVIYFASGFEKALGEQWRSGEAIWRALMATHDPLFDYSFIATIPGLATGLCWMTLLLEIGAVAFVWHPLTRRLWLVGIVGMHLGIAVAMNLWTFSATMIVFDIAVFGITANAEILCAARARNGHAALDRSFQGQLVARLQN